ncbi:MAG: rcsF protein [Gammaproteobacteria bacterium]|nr:MAG: rcsF protein [Gammaproteobacteria bacterium]
MKNSLLKTSFTISILSLLSSCSNFTVTTNIDKEKFKDYLSPQYVTIFENEAQLPTFNQYIGLVEGESCQLKPYLASPSKIDARTQARRRAYKMQANAVVFTNCAQRKTERCHQLLICFGKAYQVQN